MNRVLFGDCRESLQQLAADGVRVQTCVTSPPYFGLRDYGVDGQLGLEQTPDEYVARMVEVFRCVRDVLADDGTLWLNIGDSYAGSWGAQSRGNTVGEATSRLQGTSMLSARQIAARPLGLTGTGSVKNTPGIKPKDMIGIPWMLAFALRADGWYLRQEIIWHKPNPMPESVRDRCTKAHESIFLLAKSERYFYDHEAIKEPAVGVQSGTGVGWNHTAAADPRDARGIDRGRTKRDNFKRDGSKREQAIPGQSVGTHREDRPDSTYDLFTRNRRSVWTIPTRPYKGAHFAVFPPALVEPCILAGSRPGDVVLDPFMGSGTTAEVAVLLGRQFLGCELNEGYKPLQDERIDRALAQVRVRDAQLQLFDSAA